MHDIDTNREVNGLQSSSVVWTALNYFKWVFLQVLNLKVCSQGKFYWKAVKLFRHKRKVQRLKQINFIWGINNFKRGYKYVSKVKSTKILNNEYLVSVGCRTIYQEYEASIRPLYHSCRPPKKTNRTTYWL